MPTREKTAVLPRSGKQPREDHVAKGVALSPCEYGRR
jgi:hypothetical protein